MRKLLLWCASLAVLGLAACDNSTSSDSSSTPSELVGIWKDSIPHVGVVYLQLKSDESGLAKMYSPASNGVDSMPGTWKVAGNKLIVTGVLFNAILDDTVTYKISGSDLTLTGSKLAAQFSLPTNVVFTKTTAIVAPKF